MTLLAGLASSPTKQRTPQRHVPLCTRVEAPPALAAVGVPVLAVVVVVALEGRQFAQGEQCVVVGYVTTYVRAWNASTTWTVVVTMTCSVCVLSTGRSSQLHGRPSSPLVAPALLQLVLAMPGLPVVEHLEVLKPLPQCEATSPHCNQGRQQQARRPRTTTPARCHRLKCLQPSCRLRLLV